MMLCQYVDESDVLGGGKKCSFPGHAAVAEGSKCWVYRFIPKEVYNINLFPSTVPRKNVLVMSGQNLTKIGGPNFTQVEV